ncbi:MAG: alanine racemase, partial [Pseudonocardiaceae bacterium]
MGSPTNHLTVAHGVELRRAYDRATQELDTPLVVADLGAFDANADELVRRAAGCPIRVVSKSIRCRHLLERALAKPGMRGVLCYSPAEALWLHGLGVSDDLVVGYPSVDRNALRRIAGEDMARSAITLMIDSIEQLDLIEHAAGQALDRGPELRVCLELDVSWRPMPGVHVGTRRSPVFTPEHAVDLARKIVARKGFRLVGLMGYEGQIAGVGDVEPNPAKSFALRMMQRLSADELNGRRAAAVAAVREVVDLEFVNGGGTGSIESTVEDRSVTEVAAGSGLIGPTLFDGYSRFRPRPAVLFALSVVRKSAPEVATLYSGGYIASGPVGPSRLPVPYLPDGLKLLSLEGAGEVQTPVHGDAAKALRIGDRVWMRHAKAGELAERFTTYHVVAGGRLER